MRSSLEVTSENISFCKMYPTKHLWVIATIFIVPLVLPIEEICMDVRRKFYANFFVKPDSDSELEILGYLISTASFIITYNVHTHVLL